MADIADDADPTIEMHLTRSLQRAVGKSGPESHPDFNGRDCVGCEEPIESGRLALGKVLCIECRRLLEKRRAQFA